MNFVNSSKFILTTVAFLLAGLLTACNNEEQGSIRVLLTDSPAYYDEVNIEITKVRINKNYDDNKVLPWEEIFEGSMQVNLLDYQHGNTLELGEAKMEAGEYSQIRFELGDDNNVVIDGETFPLNKPSNGQSEFKVPIKAEVEDGKVTEVVIDFDARLTVVFEGGDSYTLRPILRFVNLQESGSISGRVLPVEAKPVIHASSSNTNIFYIRSTQADAEGNFKIIGLSEGKYDVFVQPDNESYVISIFEDIEIAEGEEYTFDETIVLEEQPAEN